MGLRKNILRNVEKFRRNQEEERAAAKTKNIEFEVCDIYFSYLMV